jgi:hypothetical protein
MAALKRKPLPDPAPMPIASPRPPACAQMRPGLPWFIDLGEDAGARIAALADAVETPHG